VPENPDALTEETIPSETNNQQPLTNPQQPTTNNESSTAHQPQPTNSSFRAGIVALIGKPNVGKSTLLNRIVGQKVSIVSSKPQTTRRRVIGIAQGKNYQIAFMDTPGIHEPHTQLGRAMVDQARASLSDADVILYVADGAHPPGDGDREIARMLFPKGDAAPKIPVLLCMNKMDILRAEAVVPNMEAYTKLLRTEEYMMTTATRGDNVPLLVEMLVKHLPEQDPLFPEDEFTNQSSRFMAGELVREKILVATRQEVPHATAVMVDSWDETNPELTVIQASILVEKSSQRAILLGKGGQFIKAIGTNARAEIEELLGHRIYLELHVRVQEGWRMNPRVLHELEYDAP
jgi:GTP-binding protein Era